MCSNNKQTKFSLKGNSNWRYWFLLVTILSCCFVVSCSYILHNQIAEESVFIAQTFQKANADIRTSLNSLKPDTINTQYVINEQVIQQMEHNYQMIKELLDVEFSRIQTERNVLEIWAAVITIVFLVFSFYSTFKTDDMVKDARSILDSLDAIHAKAGEEKSTIEGELRGILTPYSAQAKTLADNISKMESELGKISDLPERLKKIDGLDKFVADSNKTLESLQKSLEEHEKTICSLREDVDELNQLEPDEEDT